MCVRYALVSGPIRQRQDHNCWNKVNPRMNEPPALRSVGYVPGSSVGAAREILSERPRKVGYIHLMKPRCVKTRAGKTPQPAARRKARTTPKRSDLIELTRSLAW